MGRCKSIEVEMSATKRLRPQGKPQPKKKLRKRGKGDSVKEIAAYRGNATIEEIYKRVREWQAKQPRKA
jgi:hypothetical protein